MWNLRTKYIFHSALICSLSVFIFKSVVFIKIILKKCEISYYDICHVGFMYNFLESNICHYYRYCDNLCQENVGYSAANYIWSLTVKGNKLFKITNALNQSSFYTPELLNNVDAENVVTVNQENELLELIANISCWENRWR